MAVKIAQTESSNATAGGIKEVQAEAQCQAQPEKNAYEILRIKNIKRNNARLRSLGLISIFEEKRSNAIAEGIDLHADDEETSDHEDDEWKDEAAGNRKKKRKRKSEKNQHQHQQEPREGSRKSKRLQGVGIDNEPLSKLPEDREFVMRERSERVQECREVRLRAAKAVAECGAEKAAKENPTATYEHCLHRVRSMTDKGLANRVKAIERAAGKHCVVKMAIFKSCLQDENMWELAELAREALERLKALKPIPD